MATRSEVLFLPTYSPEYGVALSDGATLAVGHGYGNWGPAADMATVDELRSYVRRLAIEAGHFQQLARTYRAYIADTDSADDLARDVASYKAKFLSLGCGIDSAVALIGVCADEAEYIAAHGEPSSPHGYLESITEWLRENGHGQRDYRVTVYLTATAPDEDSARDQVAEMFRSGSFPYGADVAVEEDY